METNLLQLLLSLLLLGWLSLLSSCSSFTDAAQTAAGASLGAAVAGSVGYAASGGNVPTTAMSGLAGAAGGGLLTSLFQSGVKKKKIEERQRGYDLGRSDAIKSIYWMARNLQKPKDGENKEVMLQMVEERTDDDRTNDQINHVAYAETLPVQ